MSETEFQPAPDFRQSEPINPTPQEPAAPSAPPPPPAPEPAPQPESPQESSRSFVVRDGHLFEQY